MQSKYRRKRKPKRLFQTVTGILWALVGLMGTALLLESIGLLPRFY